MKLVDVITLPAIATAAVMAIVLFVVLLVLAGAGAIAESCSVRAAVRTR